MIRAGDAMAEWAAGRTLRAAGEAMAGWAGAGATKRARIGATGVAVMAMAAIHGAGFGIQAQTVALTGGLVLPISSEPVEGGTVLIVDGRIAAVGADVAIPAGAEVVDVTGSVVMPGIIDAMSYFGVAGEDMNEVPVPLTPELRIIEAFSPFGAFGSGAAGEIRVRELLQGGVTAMYIGPGDATVLGGQGVVVKSAGERFGDLIVREPAAIDITLGGRPASTYRDMSRSPSTRMAVVSQLRELLVRAQEWVEGGGGSGGAGSGRRSGRCRSGRRRSERGRSERGTPQPRHGGDGEASQRRDSGARAGQRDTRHPGGDRARRGVRLRAHH